MLYMVTFTINIPPMLVYIPAPWILWDISCIFQFHGSNLYQLYRLYTFWWKPGGSGAEPLRKAAEVAAAAGAWGSSNYSDVT